MDAVHPDLEHGTLPRLADGGIEILFGLAHDLLDPARVDAAV